MVLFTEIRTRFVVGRLEAPPWMTEILSRQLDVKLRGVSEAQKRGYLVFCNMDLFNYCNIFNSPFLLVIRIDFQVFPFTNSEAVNIIVAKSLFNILNYFLRINSQKYNF